MSDEVRIPATPPAPNVSVFEERAENLSKDELEGWSTNSPKELALLKKLRGPGAKLLSGPRGSGKSTLLRRAYFQLLDRKEVLVAYVNYARSLALEPLFHRRADALVLFRQWTLHKVVDGVTRYFTEIGEQAPTGLVELGEVSQRYIHELESAVPETAPEPYLSPTQLLSLLEGWARSAGLKRTVLLMDDAAHAFSHEQQREFFEVFRNLRSRTVAAKAAVYPGITAYSPHFHVGHEAELIEAWHRPEGTGFLDAMKDAAKKRLPPDMFERFDSRMELLDYLALASFGLPRAYWLMLSQVLGVDEGGDHTPSRRKAREAVSSQAWSLRAIFAALAQKLPRYKKFIEVGHSVERTIAETLRSYNKNKLPGASKATTLGIVGPIEAEFARVLGLLEYAGIVRAVGTVSRGVKGVFYKYELHYSLVLSQNSLSLGRNPALSSEVRSLSSQSAHAFPKMRAASLLPPEGESYLTLDLAPCQSCGATRTSEEARFCVRCGTPLEDASVYEELLRSSIERLPLTQNKIDALLANTSIRKIQDILVDDEMVEIRKAPYVGSVWAARIRTAAEEYVSV